MARKKLTHSALKTVCTGPELLRGAALWVSSSRNLKFLALDHGP